MQQNVAALQAKEREERLKIKEAQRPLTLQPSMTQDSQNIPIDTRSTEGTNASESKDVDESAMDSRKQPHTPSKTFTTVPPIEPSETQSWSPKIAQRRSWDVFKRYILYIYHHYLIDTLQRKESVQFFCNQSTFSSGVDYQYNIQFGI